MQTLAYNPVRGTTKNQIVTRMLVANLFIRRHQRWLNATVKEMEANEIKLSIPRITPKTFRHSYGVNAIPHLVHIRALQAWMGHKKIESTEIYTKVLMADTYYMAQRVQFS